jgi:hypothetical protein
MIENKKEFFIGFVMMLAFIVVIAIFFSPVFGNNQTGLQYLDSLYNSISKGSAYYVPVVQDSVKKLAGKPMDMNIPMDDDAQAKRMVIVLQKTGAEAVAEGKNVKVKGDMGGITMASLADADFMYHNDGKAISSKYSIEERQVMVDWWRFNRSTQKELNKVSQFEDAKVFEKLNSKVVETAYNYYKIEPKKITGCIGVVVFSLVFYVIYTMWYGYSILFMFEGWGMKFGH